MPLVVEELRVVDGVRALVTAVDGLCAADPSTLADGDSLVALHRELDRLSAVATRAAAAFDAGGSWAAEGARSSAAWMAARCGLPVATARRRVRLGRGLRRCR
jgi:glutamate 5-kinase